MQQFSKELLSLKYARAFTNIHSDKITYDDLSNIENLIKFLKEEKRLFFYLRLSFIEEEIRILVFNKLLEKFKLKEIFQDLFILLMDQNRVSLLIHILEHTVKIIKNKLGIIQFTFYISHELKKEYINTIEKFLENKTGKKIIYKKIIDPSLIAGLKLINDNYLWEYSIKQQLLSLGANKESLWK